MIDDILFALWFLLPAALANAIPVIVSKAPVVKNYDAPIDAGRKYKGREILGPHKTWRGIIAGIVISTLALWLQQYLVAEYTWAHDLSGNVDYAALPTLLLGPLFAIGALGGDALESFFKRRKEIGSGTSWVPFDQIDYIIGSVFISLFFVLLTPVRYIWIFIVWFLLHLLASYIGYKLGLKKEPI